MLIDGLTNACDVSLLVLMIQNSIPFLWSLFHNHRLVIDYDWEHHGLLTLGNATATAKSQVGKGNIT